MLCQLIFIDATLLRFSTFSCRCRFSIIDFDAALLMPCWRDALFWCFHAFAALIYFRCFFYYFSCCFTLLIERHMLPFQMPCRFWCHLFRWYFIGQLFSYFRRRYSHFRLPPFHFLLDADCHCFSACFYWCRFLAVSSMLLYFLAADAWLMMMPRRAAFHVIFALLMPDDYGRFRHIDAIATISFCFFFATPALLPPAAEFRCFSATMPRLIDFRHAAARCRCRAHIFAALTRGATRFTYAVAPSAAMMLPPPAARHMPRGACCCCLRCLCWYMAWLISADNIDFFHLPSIDIFAARWYATARCFVIIITPISHFAADIDSHFVTPCRFSSLFFSSPFDYWCYWYFAIILPYFHWFSFFFFFFFRHATMPDRLAFRFWCFLRGWLSFFFIDVFALYDDICFILPAVVSAAIFRHFLRWLLPPADCRFSFAMPLVTLMLMLMLILPLRYWLLPRFQRRRHAAGRHAFLFIRCFIDVICYDFSCWCWYFADTPYATPHWLFQMPPRLSSDCFLIRHYFW